MAKYNALIFSFNRIFHWKFQIKKISKKTKDKIISQRSTSTEVKTFLKTKHKKNYNIIEMYQGGSISDSILSLSQSDVTFIVNNRYSN